MATRENVYEKPYFFIDCNDYYDNDVAFDRYSAKGLTFEIERDEGKSLGICTLISLGHFMSTFQAPSYLEINSLGEIPSDFGCWLDVSYVALTS